MQQERGNLPCDGCFPNREIFILIIGQNSFCHDSFCRMKKMFNLMPIHWFRDDIHENHVEKLVDSNLGNISIIRCWTWCTEKLPCYELAHLSLYQWSFMMSERWIPGYASWRQYEVGVHVSTAQSENNRRYPAWSPFWCAALYLKISFFTKYACIKLCLEGVYSPVGNKSWKNSRANVKN